MRPFKYLMLTGAVVSLTGPAVAQEMRADDLVSGSRYTLLRDAASGLAVLPGEVTGQFIKTMLDPTLDRLEEMSQSLTHELGSILSIAMGDLNRLLLQFEEALEADFAVPLAQASFDARLLGNQLYAAAVRLSALLNHSNDCITHNADLFTGALRSTIAEAKEIPVVSEGRPWVSTYRFDGYRTANAVPAEGGLFTVSGFKLWSSSRVPDVTLRVPTHSDSVVQVLTPLRARDDHTMRLNLSPDLVTLYAGDCLDLYMVLYDGDSASPRVTERALPLCLPKRFDLILDLAGYVHYDTMRTVRRDLQAKGFPQGINHDCSQPASYNESLSWLVDDGFEIVDFRRDFEDHRHDKGFAMSISIVSRTTVRASGTIAEASCVGPFGTSHAYWRAQIVPIVEGKVRDAVQDSAQGRIGPFTRRSASTCIYIPKRADTDRTVTWFTLGVAGDTSAPTFRSPRFSVSRNDHAEPLTPTFLGYTVDIRFNPTSIDGTCEMCISLTDTNACDF